MPEVPVLVLVAMLVGGLVLMRRRTPREVADDEPQRLDVQNHEGDQ